MPGTPGQPTPDRELLCAAAAGDRDAFDQFVRQHTAAILRFCLLRIGDRQDSEDAAQEAMVRLYEQVARNRIPQEPLPWLFSIARRCCHEILRRRKRDSREPLTDEACSWTGDPARNEALERLRAALTELNDFETAVLYLKHTEGLRCREISERLDKPLGTVTAALSRVYGKLRSRLAQFEGENKP
jgi:RNA polymerase sigma-70 factor (ECF subfamily)